VGPSAGLDTAVVQRKNYIHTDRNLSYKNNEETIWSGKRREELRRIGSVRLCNEDSSTAKDIYRQMMYSGKEWGRKA
jgi:hypothetical protein